MTEAEYHILTSLAKSVTLTERTQLKDIQADLRSVVVEVQKHISAKYVVLFAGLHRGDTLLIPFAVAGSTFEGRGPLPHYNWRKARLPLVGFDLWQWNLKQNRDMALRGLRGETKVSFADASFVVPVSIGDQYRSVLIVGPFPIIENQNLITSTLCHAATILAWSALINTEIYYQATERKRWESTISLLSHQFRTVLIAILGPIGRAKYFVREARIGVSTAKIVGFLERAEASCKQLVQASEQTMRGHVLHIERDDLEIENYPLSALVMNTVDGFAYRAQQEGRILTGDDSLESLPVVPVDVSRFTIVLSNLIDNAIKYSFPQTTIQVRSFIDFQTFTEKPEAVIQVINTGHEIQPDERLKIFEQGVRGLVQTRSGEIPGSGLGLWEAMAVVQAHDGTIDVESTPVQNWRGNTAAYLTVFSVRIPILDSTER